jgi:uncharacterized protein (DUF2147 family)
MARRTARQVLTRRPQARRGDRAAAPALALGLALAGAALGAGAAGPARAGDVTGLWETPVSHGLIRIERCGEKLCGRSVSSDILDAHPGQSDMKNPDPALRGRPIKGLVILEVSPLGEDRWGQGWIYNPNDGATYHLSLKLDSPTRLKITGCLVAPLCKSQVWLRSEG